MSPWDVSVCPCPAVWVCAEPPLPSRCCPRGPTCQASAAPTAGATGAASKPGEGWGNEGASTGGSRRGCEGGCTGEAGGVSWCVGGWRRALAPGVPGFG